jgi:hypothetical protein
MPTKPSIHTFKQGMVKDLDRSLVSSDAYTHAENFRIVTNTGESTGSLENILGNNYIGSLVPEGYTIVGSCMVRSTLVLFITNGANNAILKVWFNTSTETVSYVSLAYDDDHNGGAGSLNFSTSYPIKAIGRYETPDIQKVYWTDGLNPIRYMNIAANLTVDGGVYTADNYMPPEMFEFVPLFLPSQLVLDEIVAGHLNTGMVQYSYQLYRLNGSSTVFAPVSDMIHIVSDNDFAGNDRYYTGDTTSVDSSKGVKLTMINSNAGYSRLRLIRIQYTTAGSLPTITVATEIEIPTTAGNIISITDIGNTVDTLTLDEFNLASTELFTCEDITTKDNRLFAANITKTDLTGDLGDFDSRAVRFHVAALLPNTHASVWDTTTGELQIDDSFSNWGDYGLTHDGMNYFNNPDNDGDPAYEFKYQSNGTILGAEGPNILIDFQTEYVNIDTSNTDSLFATNPSGVRGNNEDANDSSYLSYASPWKGGKLSWQRDETYRLFIVYGDDRGQTTTPQWICDLRMPSFHDDVFYNDYGGPNPPHSPAVLSLVDEVDPNNVIKTARLYPRIVLRYMPTGFTWARIHRIERTDNDKSILTQAYVVPSYSFYGGSYYGGRPARANLPISLSASSIIKLVSPEISVNKDMSEGT